MYNYNLCDNEYEIDILNQIISIIKNNPHNWIRVLKSRGVRCDGSKTSGKDNSRLIDFIRYKTPLLQDGTHKLSEMVYWCLYGLTDFPKCHYSECNNKVHKFYGFYYGYQNHCNNLCSKRDKNTKEKTQRTNVKKYGVEYPSQNREIRDKQKKTCKINYGYENYTETDTFKQLISGEKSKERVHKQFETKLKNGTTNTSNAEEELYLKLCQLYGADNIKRQYVDKRYPFHCDFYIIPYDVFIEYNGHWSHGNHKFDSKYDAETLKTWIEKAITSRYYKVAINVWTVKDVNKRNTAIQNNLKYIELWNNNDIQNIEQIIKKYITNP